MLGEKLLQILLQKTVIKSAFSTPTFPINVLLIPSGRALNYRSSSQSSFLTGLEEPLQIGNEGLSVLTDTGATFSEFNPISFRQIWPQSTKKVQIMGSQIYLNRFLSLNLCCFVQALETYSTLSSQFLHPIHLLSQDLLKMYVS